MIQHLPGNSTLVAVHAYKGDAHQVEILMPVFEHHKLPIVILSPCDAPITTMGPHICRQAGQVAYVGQKSWDRQYEQLKTLLDYPQKWFLCNDSDSFCLSPELPEYIYRDENTVWSNEVDDFRKPGETYPGHTAPWPLDYHKGFPLIAMQPPYFFSRRVLEKIVKNCKGMVACPITPFIDWWWIPACDKAHVKHAAYTHRISCGTHSPEAFNTMAEFVSRRGAIFLHSVKTADVLHKVRHLYNVRH